jgi:nicotinamide-nucleotide amidase
LEGFEILLYFGRELNAMATKPEKNWTAEVMSVGDEITTGHRLDTNTQWICQRLGDLGIRVRFLTGVGDDLADHVLAVRTAMERVDLVVMTGGLGPTADDLTRQAIAAAFEVPLELQEEELFKIEKIFQRSNRPMPANNRHQAMFPAGAIAIPNREGTAPGIDLVRTRDNQGTVRVVALPGVPAEMKQMWSDTVEGTLKEWIQSNSMFCHHTLHCFGAGESHIEEMLPRLIERGRDPSVGITASQATISLRIATRAPSLSECQTKMQPTIDLIRDKLGDLVFGENGQTLPDVVAEQLMNLKLTIALLDFGLNGALKSELDKHQPGLCQLRMGNPDEFLMGGNMVQLTESLRRECASSMGVVIGPIDRNESIVTNGKSQFLLVLVGPCGIETHELRYWGHSAWRDDRALKQVLNQIRLHLRKS